MAGPPAGWYSDPYGGGGRRYWDGDRWTEHTAGPASPPAGGQETQAGGQETQAGGYGGSAGEETQAGGLSSPPEGYGSPADYGGSPRGPATPPGGYGSPPGGYGPPPSGPAAGYGAPGGGYGGAGAGAAGAGYGAAGSGYGGGGGGYGAPGGGYGAPGAAYGAPGAGYGPAAAAPRAGRPRWLVAAIVGGIVVMAAIAVAAVLLLTGGSSDKKFSVAGVPFTFDYPKGFHRTNVPFTPPPKGQVGIDDNDAIVVAQLDVSGYKSQLSDHGVQGNVAGEPQRHNGVSMLVFEFDNPSPVYHERDYFFTIGSRSWNVSCTWQPPKRSKMEAACNKAVDSVQPAK